MKVWFEMPGYIPADGTTVLCRRITLAPPFLATWNLSSQTFTTQQALTLPWYAVLSWRNQNT